MFDFLLRFGPLAVGIVLASASWSSWTFGAPPPWSVFGPKTTETVLEARVLQTLASNGTTRFLPIVKVTAPGEVQQLDGLVPSFASYSREMATDAVSGYAPGEQVRVRWVDGKAMADRTDLFGMAHAVAMTVFAILLLLAGGFWAWAMGRKPAKTAGT